MQSFSFSFIFLCCFFLVSVNVFVLFCCFVFFIFRAAISLFLFNLTFENLILHISSHNYDNHSMFPDVPECSGMFHVPGFIDGLKMKCTVTKFDLA